MIPALARPPRLLTLLLLGLLAALAPPAQAQSRGIPNQSFGPDQLFQVQGGINAGNGAPHQHSTGVVVQGYLVQVYSTGNANPAAGIAVYDIVDPRLPQLIARTETDNLTEQHAIAFSPRGDRLYSAHLAADGIELWDWTDITQPTRAGAVILPGIVPGYSRGAWWLAWQDPLLYISGASNGLYLVDTTDMTAPKLVDRGGAPNPIPPAELGGFRVGSVFAVGNLLVLSANDGAGYATLDISDPTNPRLLTARVEQAPGSYSSMVNGGRLYAAGIDAKLHVFDLLDPAQLAYLGAAPLDGRGAYLVVQDDYAHVGASNHYVKIHIGGDDMRPIGSASSGRPDRDEDFVTVVGNLALVSDDHGNGSVLAPHQTGPDTTGPRVTMVVPPDGAAGQAQRSRIGLTFSDQLDLASINLATIQLRPQAGDPITGSFSVQTGIVNFTPAQPLQPDTTYEVVVPAGGVRDVVGNPTSEHFQSRFSTGDQVGQSFWCSLEPPPPVVVGELVDLRARLISPPANVSFRWDFGDGTPAGLVSPGDRATYGYQTPGRYTVRLTLTSTTGATACATRVTVYAPLRPGTPQNSSTIILDRSGTQVWVVNPDHNTISVVDAVHLGKMAEIEVGARPRTLAPAADGTVWTVNQDDATLSILDGSNFTRQATVVLPRGSDPYGIVISSRAPLAYVSLQATGQLAEVDVATRIVRRVLAVGPSPRALALTADGTRLFITRWISDATQGEVVEIDLDAWRVTQRVGLVLDPGPDTEASGRGVPNGLSAAAINPAGSELWVGGRKSNTARGLTRDGAPLTFESTVRSLLAVVDLTRHQEIFARRYDFNDRDGPVALRFSPRGDYVFALLEGSNAVDIVDAYSGELAAAIEGVGHAPQGMVFTADGSKLFVDSWLSRTVQVYDLSPFLRGESTQIVRLAEIATTATEPLTPQQLAGKQIFYHAADPRMSRDGYLSCAACHFDGRDDGQVWDRTAEGEGLRNTQSLVRSGRADRGALHWSANFDEIQDFEHDIRTAFGGTGFAPNDLLRMSGHDRPLGTSKAGISPELDALAAYVATLDHLPPSPYRAADGSLTADAVAGRAHFYAAGCAACHTGPEFTDSPFGLMHQIGTLTPASGQRLGQPLLGLDTPSLRGLWLSPPYLHDGSAPTLADVLTARNPQGLHGNLAPILADNPRALDQLVAYLLQLDDAEPGPGWPAPALELVLPTGAALRVGQAITLAANTAPVLGPVAQVEFLINGQIIAPDADPIYTITWTPTAPGSVTIMARLIYVNGAATLSAPHTLTVAP